MKSKPITIHNYRKKKKAVYSSAEKFGTNKTDYIFHIENNVYFINFRLHGDFINLKNQPQTNEQSLPAWLAD